MEDNLEKICADTKRWITCDTPNGILKIYTRCNCGRFLKIGNVRISIEGLVFFGWDCKKCGEVKPFHLID